MSTVATQVPSPFDQPLGIPAARISPDEFRRIAENSPINYELVDGKLVEKPVSDYSYLVAQTLSRRLTMWAEPINAGLAFMETYFQCFRDDPGRIRRPDVAFVSAARWATYRWGQSNLTVVPDLVAEVLSPREEAFEIDDKVIDYLATGVRRVLVLNPKTRIIRVHRALGDVGEIVGDDRELADDEVLPGFRCTLHTLFAVPGETPAARL
jgi:Uma2 family endonuclease